MQPRMSPCQYDSNPGLFGWMKPHRLRDANGPSRRRSPIAASGAELHHDERSVTRMVAQHSVRTVAYNVTRMETIQTSTAFPVCRVVMVAGGKSPFAPRDRLPDDPDRNERGLGAVRLHDPRRQAFPARFPIEWACAEVNEPPSESARGLARKREFKKESTTSATRSTERTET